MYKEWIWYTQLNFNVLLYGIGEKSEVLIGFAKTYLFDEDVICVEGRPVNPLAGTSADSSETFRELLDVICSETLRLSPEEMDAHSELSTARYTQKCWAL